MRPLLLITLLLAGCASEYFGINKFDRGSDAILGEILSSDIYLVDPFATNGFKVMPGGSAAIKDFYRTNHMADITLSLENGEGLRIATRTVSHGYMPQSGITIDLTRNGTELSENGRLLHRFGGVSLLHKEDMRIRLVNKGSKTYFYLDCQHIFTLTSRLPCTEYIILSSLNGSSFLAKGINITGVFENEFTDKTVKSDEFIEL